MKRQECDNCGRYDELCKTCGYCENCCICDEEDIEIMSEEFDQIERCESCYYDDKFRDDGYPVCEEKCNGYSMWKEKD